MILNNIWSPTGFTLLAPQGAYWWGFNWDDIGVTVFAPLLEKVKSYTNEAVYDIEFWLRNVGYHKAKVGIITKHQRS